MGGGSGTKPHRPQTRWGMCALRAALNEARAAPAEMQQQLLYCCAPAAAGRQPSRLLQVPSPADAAANPRRRLKAPGSHLQAACPAVS